MNNIGLLLLRIVFCGAMIYGHGLGKLNKLIAGNLKFSDPIGIGEAPTLFLAVFSEFIAPIFILIGFKTKFFSFFPAATMFVAAFVVHLGDPFSRIEKAILFLAVFVFFMISGPGKYSIDKYNS
ncbi:MAG: DoxX family protein [Flavobacteriaceae bacterium]|nr:DoxX family protein [Flavobacteriaceae bacterium]MBL6685180.1 DoxX family protein [Flavobacteriaceae bacterium]|tara:strand:- start:15120 stop:15491 length:372 start_codon:yes stop_codon:yes gene_type:complete